jgi:hypothetical protein
VALLEVARGDVVDDGVAEDVPERLATGISRPADPITAVSSTS